MRELSVAVIGLSCRFDIGWGNLAVGINGDGHKIPLLILGEWVSRLPLWFLDWDALEHDSAPCEADRVNPVVVIGSEALLAFEEWKNVLLSG